jgi:hypothetical protein
MQILDIEQGLSHERFYFRGSYIYPLVKQEILLPGLEEHRDQFPRERQGRGEKLKALVSLCRNSFRLLTQARPGTCDYLFVDSASSRRYYREGVAWSIYCDFLMEKLSPASSLLLELPFPRQSRPSSIATRNIYRPDLDFLRIFVRSLFARRRYREAAGMIAELSRFQVRVDQKALHRLLRRFTLYRRWAGRIIRKTAPKVMFVVSPYSYIRMALVSACKQQGVPVVELQHGQISAQHYGYIYRHLENRDLVPDYLFAYGSYFRRLLQEHSVLYGPGQIFVTGNLFLEEKARLKKGPAGELVKAAGKRQILLISSQTPTRNEMRDLCSFLVEEVPGELFILYKPHPIEHDAGEFYRDLDARESFCLVKDPELSSLDLLNIADLHMTVYSTVFMEASYFGVPTLFYHIEGLSNNILEFVDDEFYFLIHDRKEMLKTLKILRDRGRGRAGDPDRPDFYQPDPWECFSRALKAIGG